MNRPSKNRTRRVSVPERAAAALLILGLAQMAGDLAGIPMLKGFAMATAASPAPRVFSAIRGFEAYSTRFVLEWRDRDGGAHLLPLTPVVYERLSGAYNRRNAYGAALAGGPILATDPRTEAMFRAAFAYALCDEAPLLRELGLGPVSLDGGVTVRYVPLPSSRMDGLPRTLSPVCS